jgi:hypothetical protein
MTVATTDTDVSAPPPPATVPPAAPPRRPRLSRALRAIPTDVIAVVGYLFLALCVLGRLYTSPGRRIAGDGLRQQATSEWFLAHGARVLTHMENPFFSNRYNVPGGVNVLAGQGFLGLSVPLTPLTLALGPAVTYAIAATLCLAGTAFAWYFVLSRHIIRSRATSLICGTVGGFAPAMVAHAQGDLGLVAQFLIPFIIWRFIRLADEGRAVRNGLILGILAAWQGLIESEMLFIVILGTGLFLLAYGLQNRALARVEAPQFLRGLAVATIVTAVILGVPLWYEVFGPAGAKRAPANITTATDVFSFFRFAMPSWATYPVGRLHYANSVTEQNTFFGWPLLALVGVAVLWLRTRAVRAVAAAGIVMALFALGDRVLVRGHLSHLPGPWRIFSWIPGINSIVPTHIALSLLWVVVLVLALTGQRATELMRRAQTTHPGVPFGVAWYGLLAAALLPIAPGPVRAVDFPVLPAITQGTWRSHVPAGTSVLVLPGPRFGDPSGPRFAAATHLDLSLAGGTLGEKFEKAARTGKTQKITASDRDVAADAIQHAHVGAVMLVPGKTEEVLWKTITALLGFEPKWVDGVWIWNLRSGA